MSTFDTADFVMRLRTLFGGKRWAGRYYNPANSNQENAWNDGTDGKPVGRLYALMQPIAAQLSSMMLTMWPYVRKQTRLASLTDEYVDLAWQDFYRGRLGRIIGEQDSTSTARLRSTLVAATGTHNGVLSAVQAYFAANPDESTSQDVFDRQTDPLRSAYYGIKDAQFAVIMYYPENASNAGFFVGQSFVGQDFLTNPYAFSTSPSAPYPALSSVVNNVKDLGYRPIFIISRGEGPNAYGWGNPWKRVLWSPT